MKAIEAMRVKAVGQEGAKVEDGILVTERISTNALSISLPLSTREFGRQKLRSLQACEYYTRPWKIHGKHVCQNLCSFPIHPFNNNMFLAAEFV